MDIDFVERSAMVRRRRNGQLMALARVYVPGLFCGMCVCLLVMSTVFHGSDNSEVRLSNPVQPLRTRTRRELMKLPVVPEEIDQSTATTTWSNETRVKIQIEGKYIHEFRLTGHVLDDNGKKVEIKSQVKTSILHNFSERIKKEAKKSFLDPAGDQLYYILAPAVMYFQGRIHLTCRVWLNKERYVADFFQQDNLSRTMNDIQDNTLYVETLDAELRPLTHGQILGIPLDKQLEMSEGTLEPRMFSIQNRLFVTFNANVQYPGIGRLDSTFMYDLQRHDVLIPNITGQTPSVSQTSEWFPTDKAWMALRIDGELYFVHNLDPLWVMKCDLEMKCSWIYKQRQKKRFIYQSEPYVGSLRGGSPFEHYEGDYYLSIAHNTLRKGNSHKRFYTTHLVLLYANPSTTKNPGKGAAPFRIVYISENIQFHPTLMKNVPMQPTKTDDMDESFAFPVSMIIESQDSIVIGAHINDMRSVLLRFEGLDPLMKTVIAADKKLGPRQGAPLGYLQKHTREMHETGPMWYV